MSALATQSSAPTWDIFCAVVDNYGDIGVTWRLARQLAAEYGFAVRLWVDDPNVLRRLWPAAQALPEQVVAGVTVRCWPREFPAVDAADVVIEAFACALPARYIAAMAARPRAPLWLNLEYLSAEDWVSGCHGLPSPQPRWGLTKYFFFPGFGAGSGGLLRERGLLAERRRFQSDPANSRAFLSALGLAPPAAARCLSLFAYDNPAIPQLLAALAGAGRPSWCLVPEGRAQAAVAGFCGAEMAPGTQRRQGALTVAILPFLPQPDYDRLLWSCALNFVRGEDSFLRAQWAGRPAVWQIYPQPDGAHRAKLDAIKALNTQQLTPTVAAALAAAWRAWNSGGSFAAAWPQFEAALPELNTHAQNWAERQGREENLAARLVQFCANQV
jgi:uncharacterized repeat protein (TIGR03837 family)